jgi:hypothetical protein
MDLKNIVLSEVSQAQKAKYMWIIDLKQILLDMGHTLRGEHTQEE